MGRRADYTVAANPVTEGRRPQNVLFTVHFLGSFKFCTIYILPIQRKKFIRQLLNFHFVKGQDSGAPAVVQGVKNLTTAAQVTEVVRVRSQPRAGDKYGPSVAAAASGYRGYRSQLWLGSSP